MFEGCVKRFTFFPCLNGVKPWTNNSNEAYALSQLFFGSELLKRPKENDLGAHDSFNFYCLYMNQSWIHCKKMRGIRLAWRAVCNMLDGGCRFCIKIISLNAWVHFVLRSWKTLYLKHSKALASSLQLLSNKPWLQMHTQFFWALDELKPLGRLAKALLETTACRAHGGLCLPGTSSGFSFLSGLLRVTPHSPLYLCFVITYGPISKVPGSSGRFWSSF